MPLSIPVFISSKQAELAVERELIAERTGVCRRSSRSSRRSGPRRRKPIETSCSTRSGARRIYVGLFASVYSEPTELEYREALKNPYREVLLYIKKDAASRREARDARRQHARESRRHHVLDLRDLLRHFTDHVGQAVSRMMPGAAEARGRAPPIGHGPRNEAAAAMGRGAGAGGGIRRSLRLSPPDRDIVIHQLKASHEEVAS